MESIVDKQVVCTTEYMVANEGLALLSEASNDIFQLACKKAGTGVPSVSHNDLKQVSLNV